MRNKATLSISILAGIMVLLTTCSKESNRNLKSANADTPAVGSIPIRVIFPNKSKSGSSSISAPENSISEASCPADCPTCVKMQFTVFGPGGINGQQFPAVNYTDCSTVLTGVQAGDGTSVYLEVYDALNNIIYAGAVGNIYVPPDANAAAQTIILNALPTQKAAVLGLMSECGGSVNMVILSNRAYIATASCDTGLMVVNITDPTAPVIEGSASFGASGKVSISVSGNYAYVATGTTLEIIDVSIPTSPTDVKSYTKLNAQINGVSISGNYAYLSYYDTSSQKGGFQILDVTDPTNPVEKGNLGNLSSADGVAVSGNYAFVIAPCGISVINVLNPLSPTFVKFVTTGSGNSCYSGSGGYIFLSGNYIYVRGGLGNQQVDISNPATPTLAKSWVWDAGMDINAGISIKENYAYGIWNKELEITDFSSEFPYPILLESFPNYLGAVSVVGNYAYLAGGGGLSTNDSLFYVYDLSGGW